MKNSMDVMDIHVENFDESRMGVQGGEGRVILF